MISDIKIVLASASPRRKELLNQVGLNPVIEPSGIEEIITTTIPEEAVIELSRQKAEDVAKNQLPGTVVIGADTVVAAEGKILGKPKTHEEAFEMIDSFQGKTHNVFTGVTLILCGENKMTVRSFAEQTDVHVYPMTQEEIRSYAEEDEPMDKAGAYGIQGRFAAFIKGIDGDYSNVVGLPVGRVYQELKKICEQEEKA
ncbi:septum formation protein Maf [Lacrimispora amygdalina]|uniref:dTTP/UTP pyrophosphatase n=1 Tax=Lacrimispora amygdalina TaxID=253257 RepID=A0A3E2NBS6_9FIRM|nr:Maf family protein [Clostridium indicum]RFZ78465.1 septum formation inhibitor Maf [Clostridium indicum]